MARGNVKRQALLLQKKMQKEKLSRSESSLQHVQVNIPEVFKSLLEPWRYKVCYGGRGSAKSWTIAIMLILRAVNIRRISDSPCISF